MDCLITPADSIFVAGHRGMAGSAICRAMQRTGYSQILTASCAELDLEDGPAVQRWFAEHQPTVVVLAAAKVGGIQANSSYLGLSIRELAEAVAATTNFQGEIRWDASKSDGTPKKNSST